LHQSSQTISPQRILECASGRLETAFFAGGKQFFKHGSSLRAAEHTNVEKRESAPGLDFTFQVWQQLVGTYDERADTIGQK
jgi:hypothetical protein